MTYAKIRKALKNIDFSAPQVGINIQIKMTTALHKYLIKNENANERELAKLKILYDFDMFSMKMCYMVQNNNQKIARFWLLNGKTVSSIIEV